MNNEEVLKKLLSEYAMENANLRLALIALEEQNKALKKEKEPKEEE